MSIVLKDIDFNKRKNNDYASDTTKMYSLEDYTKIAMKCISSFCGTNSAKMIKDEDAISHVAEHIMWAHIRWKPDGGRTLRSYLNQCAIWSIKVWKTKAYNEDKKNIMSIDYNINSSNSADKDLSLSDYIQDKKTPKPFDILFNNNSDDVEKIINHKCLTKLQRKCLEQRYLEGKKLRQIAESLGVTRQAVNQHVKKAIKKLRKEHGIC